MTDPQQELVDVTIHNPRTRMRGVVASNVEMRPWLGGFPVCKALNQYQIIHVGFQETLESGPDHVVYFRLYYSIFNG